MVEIKISEIFGNGWSIRKKINSERVKLLVEGDEFKGKMLLHLVRYYEELIQNKLTNIFNRRIEELRLKYLLVVFSLLALYLSIFLMQRIFN